MDSTGQMNGVKVRSIQAEAPDARKFLLDIRRANLSLGILPPVLPFAAINFGIGDRYLKKAIAIESHGGVARWILAREDMVLSTGYPKMAAHYAPDYSVEMPNGTLADQISGILPGMVAGGSTALMNKIRAWRFINLPRRPNRFDCGQPARRTFSRRDRLWRNNGKHIVGYPMSRLYAVDRTAVGIASQTDVRELSFAGCVISGAPRGGASRPCQHLRNRTYDTETK